MKYLFAIVRGICLVFLLIAHITPLAIRSLFAGIDMHYSLRIRRIWVRRTLRMLGVKVDMQGKPPTGTYVFVGNHRTYLDPIVVLKDVEALPVAKAEVASWPLIGYGGKVSGIMYVKRESKTSRAATLDAMREVLNSGHPVLVYPEGTTHIQPQTMELRPGAFRLASREGIPVVPMAIDYADMRDAWVGDDTFVPHFLRCFGKKTTYVKIRYGKPIDATDAALAVTTARDWIDKNLIEMRQEFDKELHTASSETAFSSL